MGAARSGYTQLSKLTLATATHCHVAFPMLQLQTMCVLRVRVRHLFVGVIWLTGAVASTLAMAQLSGSAPAQSLAPTIASPGTDADVKSSQQIEAAFSRDAKLPAWARPLRSAPEKKHDEAFVLRLAQTQFWAGPKPAVLVHRVLQANQTAALGQIGQLPLSFVPNYQRLTLHGLKVERGGSISDRLQSVSIRFLNSEPGLDYGIYSGGGVANLLLDDVRVGDSVHITYSIDGANPVFRDQYSDTAGWDRSDRTELRVVELIAPSGRPLNWRMIGPPNIRQPEPKLSRSGETTVTTFEDSGLEAIEDEPQIPSDYVLHRFLQFSSYRSWDEVAGWAQTLFPDVAELPPELNALLVEQKKLPTPEERVAAALRWVQSEVRYFSVSFGESSHRPYAPSEVIKRRYGDCKDKSYLLLTLLRALNIDARPILVSLRQPRGAALLLPTPHAFDHVIVEASVGGRRYYLDGTRPAQPVPLAALATAMPRALGLAADARATALVELPPIGEAQAISELDERISVARFDEPPMLLARNVVNGYGAEMIRFGWAQMTPEQRRQLANAGYEKRYPGAKPLGEPELVDDIANNRISITTKLSLPGAIRERDGDRAIAYAAESFNGFFAMPPKPKRMAPAFVAGVPSVAKYQVTVEWPETVSRMLDPVVTRVDNAFFSGESERQFRGNTFTLRSTISAKLANIAADQLAAMRVEIGKFESSLGALAYVPASSVQAQGFLGLGKLSIEQRLRRDYERRVEGATKAINGGKLSGDDLADATCERGIGHAFLGNSALAVADADAAVKASPALGEMHTCRGNIRFALGEFAPAVADYSKGLSLGASASEAYYRRGHARFYAGQLDAAAEDFSKAADEKFSVDSSGAAHYAQLWQIWTLQRLGKPVPEKLVEQVRKEADGAWPRAAMAMLLGFKTPDQVLAVLNATKGEERDMNLSEAHFIIGQHWLVRGNAAEARKAFEACRSKGIIMYIEHMAAAYELTRLKQ
jgi:transglutaminase-like putative cysteine protease/lipoprotein NlpI